MHSGIHVLDISTDTSSIFGALRDTILVTLLSLNDLATTSGILLPVASAVLKLPFWKWF